MTTTYTIQIPANVLIALSKHCNLKNGRRPSMRNVFFDIPMKGAPIAFATNGVAAGYYKLNVDSDFQREKDVLLAADAEALTTVKKDKTGMVTLTWDIDLDSEDTDTIQVTQGAVSSKRVQAQFGLPGDIRRLCHIREENAGDPAHFDGLHIAKFAPIADLLGCKQVLMYQNGTKQIGLAHYAGRTDFFSILMPLYADKCPPALDISWVNAQ